MCFSAMGENGEISLGVVIPTCSRPAVLASCLRLLRDQRPAGCAVEITVGDDSPGTETREMLARDFPGVRRVEGPRLGPGPNRNTAAAQNPGRWLVFVDDDCLPGPGLLEAYASAIRAGEGRRVVYAGSTVPCGGRDASLLWEAPSHDGDGLPPSCNFAMAAGDFRESGGFDARFHTSFEDMEFFARLTASGFSMRYVPGAEVRHPQRRVLRPSVLAGRWEARVTSAMDLGARPLELAYLLPKHVALVILSRFRGKPFSADSTGAAFLFLLEFLHVLVRLPGWISRHAGEPRSDFWARRIADGRVPKKFGL
jgi:GT2 family glycosyltransferase